MVSELLGPAAAGTSLRVRVGSRAGAILVVGLRLGGRALIANGACAGGKVLAAGDMGWCNAPTSPAVLAAGKQALCTVT